MKQKIAILVFILSSLIANSQDCKIGNSKDSLDINNVNAMLLNAGDMFWDPGASDRAKYEVPKGGGVSSLFAAALWIGGKEATTGDIYAAAETYRNGPTQSFFPGPIVDEINLKTNSVQCNDWNRHFKVSASTIEEFKNQYKTNKLYAIQTLNEGILFWPGKNNPFLNLPGNDKSYAPFEDVDNDGVYNPFNGDYPKISGHQSVWWIMNDVGGDKKLGDGTISKALGLEIQVEAFAFISDDVLNNTTFQKYRIYNKSDKTYQNTYIGMWVDADLGDYNDDFVVCDVKRGMGITYNGKPTDSKYGNAPPAMGIDFVKGIKADDNDGLDNNRNCMIDEANEEIMMSNFLYYNSSSSIQLGNPNRKSDFYNYLKGTWRDGSSMTYDGKSGLSLVSDSTPATKFMFPKDSDLDYGWGLGGNCTNPITGGNNKIWDEVTAGNDPYDRRFVMGMGEVTMKPGSILEFTVAFIYAKGTDNLNSLELLKSEDDIVQTAVDNDFINYPLSIKEKVKTTFAKVYPTQTEGTIFFQTNKTGSFNFLLFDNLGKVVFQKEVIKSAQFNISELQKGIYYYKVGNETDFQTGKILKL